MTHVVKPPLDRLARSGGAGMPLGIFIASTDPATSEIAARAGFDFSVIDAEHGPIDKLTALGHIRAAKASGLIPLVRVLEGSDTTIQAFLDVGAAGIVVPKVNTAEQARQAVAASRYAPAGRRGMCPSCHDGAYDISAFFDHMRKRNQEAMIIPIIEKKEAVDNIDEIAAVDGIDIIHFGPGDLSAEMGLDIMVDRGKLEDAWIRVRDASHAAGKYVLVPEGFGFEGADCYIVGMELMVLMDELKRVVGMFHAGAGAGA